MLQKKLENKDLSVSLKDISTRKEKITKNEYNYFKISLGGNEKKYFCLAA